MTIEFRYISHNCSLEAECPQGRDFFQKLASETSINERNETDVDSQSITTLNKIKRAPIYGSIPGENEYSICYS